jgi:hypothetical protein
MDSVKYIEMKKIALFILLIGFSNLQAQIGIGTDTPDASSILDISPTGNDRGILIPRITETQKNSITSPANGLLVFQTDNTAGFYYYSTATSSWSRMSLYSEINEYGDVKTGIQSSDHKGWVKLDGRLKSSLTSSQQARATTLGIGSNLPNADNAYLVQNGGTLGGVTGTNEKTISQANLPNVNFTGSTDNNGNHNHSIDPPLATTTTNGYHNHSSNASGNPGLVIKNSYNTTTALDSGQWNEINLVDTSSLSIDYNGNHTHTVDIASFNSATSGSHDHTVTVNSGGSATALNITPKSLSINTFIYLGN